MVKPAHDGTLVPYRIYSAHFKKFNLKYQLQIREKAVLYSRQM